MPLTIAPPQADEYASFHAPYIAAVADAADGIAVLAAQQHTMRTLAHLSTPQAHSRYAEGKWTVLTLLGHLSDVERIMSYRLLRIARGDTTPLPGFEENNYAEQAQSDRRRIAEVATELEAVRTATLALVATLDDETLARRGTVNNQSVTARGLVFIIAGHFAHHANILRDRYQVLR